MASKRVARSVVEWGAFAERVPANQKDIFRAFKAKSDMFVSKVHRYPENLPKIDFAAYRSRISTPGMVEQFEKAYGAVNVPYPADKNNTKSTIDTQEKDAKVQSEKYVAELKKSIAEAKKMIGVLDSLPAVDEMTHEMYADYFPDQARNPVKRPTFWPHTKSSQPENDPHNLN